MKKTLLITLLLCCCAIPVSAAQKIGHFNLQLVVSQSEAGKQARELHSARQRSYQADIDRRTTKLKELKDAIDKLAAGVKPGEAAPSALIEKDKEYGIQTRDLQRLTAGYQEELKVYDAELSRKVVEEFAPVLEAYARKHGFDYILRAPEAMAFAAEKLDLTEALVKEFNKQRK